jgi:hypothetical protein
LQACLITIVVGGFHERKIILPLGSIGEHTCLKHVFQNEPGLKVSYEPGLISAGSVPTSLLLESGLMHKLVQAPNKAGTKAKIGPERKPCFLLLIEMPEVCEVLEPRGPTNFRGLYFFTR